MTSPEVSIIVPCYNEEQHIRGLLDAITSQTYPINKMEVVVADGMSTDLTRDKIEEFSETHPELTVQLINNTKRNIPSALNLAIKAAKGKYIVRLDAHSLPDKNYVNTCIQHLKLDKAENVGGIWVIQPSNETAIAIAIAAAAAHPLGVGGAQYRDPKASAAYVDTVPFGSYRKDYLIELGLYDESLLSNEDYELNARIRTRDGRIFLDPAIRCTYFARHNLSALSKQYFRYGYWKFQMLKRYPGSILMRQFLPPLFVMTLMCLLVLGVFNSIFLWVFLFTATLYLSSVFVGTYLVSNSGKLSIILHLLMSISIATMHFSWGTGFILSPILGIFR